MPQGPHIDRERWARESLLSQLANISSEVGRAVTARRDGDQERFDGAFARALDLFDATLETLPTEEMHRRREIQLQRDEFVRIVTAPELDAAEAARIERYFHAFAVEHRRSR